MSAVQADAHRAGFELTRPQQEALNELLVASEHIISRAPDTRGIYLWGPAGRGKSWLMDAFYRALPVRSKTRVHFHGFLEALQRRIHAHRPEPDAVQRAVHDLTRGARVLYFDEFHVHDSGDAILLTRLLDHLVQTDTVLFATSNYAPDQLMAESPWRHVIDDAQRSIDARMRIIEIAGDHDHREDVHLTNRDSALGGRGITSGAWLTRPEPADFLREGLRTPRFEEATTLEVGGRAFEVGAARRGELWISFDQLCVVPTSTIEYLDWARRFRRWIVTDVPSFEQVGREAQQRFITVIDILTDADTTLWVTSPLTAGQFREHAEQRPDAYRMVSRLRLLRCTH